jgi:membrane protease YdiL (CAAX protease family)
LSEASDTPIGGPVPAIGQPRSEEPLDAVLLDEPPRVPGPGFWAAAGWTVLLLVLQTAATIFVSIPAAIVGISFDQMSNLLLPVASAATLLIAIALATALFGAPAPRVLALRLPARRHVALALLLVAPLAVVVQEIAAWAAEVLPTFNGEIYVEFARGPLAVVLVAGCLLPAAGEEIFFRGFLGRGLIARYGVVAGTLLSALLFGVVHIDPAQAAGVMGIGVALQLALIATRSLWIPMLIHALNNALSFGLTRQHIFEEIDHLPPMLVAAAALALVPLAVLFYQSRARWIAADGSQWSPGYATAESPPASLHAQCRASSPGVASIAAMFLTYLVFVAAVVRALQTEA